MIRIVIIDLCISKLALTLPIGSPRTSMAVYQVGLAHTGTQELFKESACHGNHDKEHDFSKQGRQNETRGVLNIHLEHVLRTVLSIVESTLPDRPKESGIHFADVSWKKI